MLTDITPIYSQIAFRSIRFGNIFATSLHNIEKASMAFACDWDIRNLTNMPSVQDIVRVYDTIQFRKKWQC
jgi:hypothetical protein